MQNMIERLDMIPVLIQFRYIGHNLEHLTWNSQIPGDIQLLWLLQQY